MNPLGKIAAVGAMLLVVDATLLCGASLLTESPNAEDFILSGPAATAPIVVDAVEGGALRRAAGDLADDIERVTGRRPAVDAVPKLNQRELILVGVVGSDPLIDRLASTGKLDVQGVAGEWESAVVETVRNPFPGVDKALVIAGSDRRGAIYGAYWISESIGVSPWYWWADVPARRRSVAAIAAGTHKLGPPDVKYRGIFLNDEDWGLRVWASRTFDPSTSNIGPKTYSRIFELLLRLRGNVLWPAMHPGTRAFNFFPEDKALADHYGIVMGSSHAEPMLRDNVDEWKRDGVGEYDYTLNSVNILRYWEERVKSNGKYENIFTIGMRGIHDGPMEGDGTPEERVERLRRIISDQRDLLRHYVNPDVVQVPQVFCPYKEVLALYQKAPGIVPGDATLLWPDDDYGYIRHFSSASERQRPGGSGVYYHISYWGRPYDYLWLCSTPPALIGEEMTKAIRNGSRQIAIVNVGDLKPAEWDIEFFMRLAWNSKSWEPANGQHAFLREIARRDFGNGNADAIAALLDGYYRLNFQRKPEHMGQDAATPLLANPVFSSDSDGDEIQRRLDGFALLRLQAEEIGKTIDREHADAFYELVLYPIRAADLMNQKWLNVDRSESYARQGRSASAKYLAGAVRAQAAIDSETDIYNNLTASGKWRGMMSDAPRNLAVFRLPIFAPPSPPVGTILGVAVEDAPISFRGDRLDSASARLVLPEFTSRVPRQRFVDVFDVGQTSFDWKISADEDWINISSPFGRGDGRVYISINWSKVPAGGISEGALHVKGAGSSVDIAVRVRNASGVPTDPNVDFAESDGKLVIDAGHPSDQVFSTQSNWEKVQGLGYDGDAMDLVELDHDPSLQPGAQKAPGELIYRFWIDTPGDWRLVTRLLPTWPLVANRPERYAVAFDADPSKVVELAMYSDENDPRWQEDVLRNATFSNTVAHLSRGPHRLRISGIDAGVVVDAFLLERTVSGAAGYLWPLETKVVGKPE
jgi:hypothetical protein